MRRRSGTPEILDVNVIDPLAKAAKGLPDGARVTESVSTMSTYSSLLVCRTLARRHGIAGPLFVGLRFTCCLKPPVGSKAGDDLMGYAVSGGCAHFAGHRWCTQAASPLLTAFPEIQTHQRRPSGRLAQCCRRYPHHTSHSATGPRHRRRLLSCSPATALREIPPRHQ